MRNCTMITYEVVTRGNSCIDTFCVNCLLRQLIPFGPPTTQYLPPRLLTLCWKTPFCFRITVFLSYSVLWRHESTRRAMQISHCYWKNSERQAGITVASCLKFSFSTYTYRNDPKRMCFDKLKKCITKVSLHRHLNEQVCVSVRSLVWN